MKLSECDLCGSEDAILYPVKVDPMGITKTKHVCDECILSIQNIELNKNGD